MGSPKPLLEAPQGGTNIVTGIGLYTNGINPRAVAVKWMAGKDSMMNDVRFLGGHGTVDPSATAEESSKVWQQIYNNTHTADSDINRRWDGQYPSLWVTNGGGGTFVDIWTPSTFAQAGLYISNTSTEGRVYELSSEHHVRNEVVLHNVSNWQIYALQTEEERGEGGFALPLEIRDSSNITVANLHMYRVVSSYQPFPLCDQGDGFEKHTVSQCPLLQRQQSVFRQRGLRSDPQCRAPPARICLADMFPATRRKLRRSRASAVFAEGAKVEKVAGGFFNISGGAVDRSGNLYFVDAKWQTIYRWSATTRQLSDGPRQSARPCATGLRQSRQPDGDLLCGKRHGLQLQAGCADDDITLLKAEPAVPRPGMTPVLPVDYLAK